MATISGELVEVGVADVLFDPVHSNVIVKQGRTVIGVGTVDADHRFEIEIPDTIEGELELVSSVVGAAPVVFEADGDNSLLVLINRGGSNLPV